MDPLTVINSELRISKTYMRKQNEWRTDRAIAIVHKDWITSLLTNKELPEFIYHTTLLAEEIQAWLYQKEQLSNAWEKIFIQIVKKPGNNDLVLPLPRPRMVNSTNESGLSYAQLLHYISETNYKNLWKHFFKKYLGTKFQNKGKFNLKANLNNKNKDILREVLRRYYGCQIILECSISDNFHQPSPSRQMEFEPHANILPALCIIEVDNYFFILYHIKNMITLKDCVTFSPMLLNSCHAKPLFIIYQLLQVMKDSHDRGLVLGNLQLDDIFVNDNLFIQVIPNIKDNMYSLSKEECDSLTKKDTENNETFQKIKSYKKNCIPDFPSDESNLHSMCFKWINGQVSNFDYLMYLNRMAGRRFGDPSCHFIMPWVSDFATRSNGNWRDLSKSKFRLNKGDRQLDLTYENASNSSQIPHHVSDVLSEITYYVYLSRRTPRSLLCKYVRSVWVPAEYPSSIQRLQEWTPDECIPEFFYDPSIFKSVHEDLPDLELPSWALTPEEFIEAHREALESKYVSERLHHWIDLTFGYKLSGTAAVKSKNVCLHLVDSHTTLTTTGVVQLFTYPHPPKHTAIPFFEKVPPKLLLGSSSRKSKQSTSAVDKTGGSEDEGHSSGNGDDDSFGAKNSPLILSKLISRSKGSLLAPFQSPSYEESSRSDQSKLSSAGPTSNATATIILPKEYNPSALLTTVETVHNFFKKTFLTEMESVSDPEKNIKSNLKQIVASKRVQEMQVLGCVISEIFLHNKLRVVDFSDLESRLKACLTFVANDNLPRCVKSALNLLLQPINQSYPYVTSNGLPPPSAHQLLQPLLSSFMFPFPKLFPTIYFSACSLMASSKAIDRCQLLNIDCMELCNNLRELKIKKFSIDLGKIWDEILSTKNDQLIDIIFPFVKELFDDFATSKLSAVFFLDKVARGLGPKRTNELLLDSVLNLYNSNSHDSNDNLYLYHKNFLLILIVRCGLKTFLENFIGPLVEAVGRYKDSPVTEKWSTKSHAEGNETENCLEMTLSPLDEDSSPDVEKKKNAKPEKEVEVFAFDKEDTPSCGESDEAVRHAVEHLDLNLISDLDQTSQDEGDVSPCAPHGGIRSPDIEIPGTSSSTRQNLIASIECNVGSKGSATHSSSLKFQNDQNCKNGFEENEVNEADNDYVHLKASDVAGDSIVWLAHRLGPVLTSRHIIRNLLRMLSVCYIGKDNLEPFIFTEADESNLWKLSIAKWKVTGDENAETVLRTLGEIAELYGEQIILLQYLPFMSDLISISKRKFTVSLEGGVIGSLSLLKYIVPFMNDSTLMDQLQDVILKSIIHPVVRLVSSTRFSFPSGQRGRYTLVTKLVDTMYLISLRIGAEMTKVHLAVPSLQRFFLAFDKAHGIDSHFVVGSYDEKTVVENAPISKSSDESRYLEIQRDGTMTEWAVRGAPGQPISIAHVRSHESLDSASPPVDLDQQDQAKNKTLNELKAVFNAQLAHLTYLPFYRFLGEATMENTLKNQGLIRDLCFQFEQVQSVHSQRDGIAKHTYLSDYLSGPDYVTEKGGSGSFGSNVAVIGNKIELQSVDVPVFNSNINGISDSEVVLLVSRKMEDSSRHLRGNWLAYWEHEIGRSDKDNKFNFKQIKLQSFNGHSNSVRMIHCLDNENSFMSGSKDKTVKLWSLRSQGCGSTTNNCQFTYNHHRKSLLSLSFVHSVRMVASCDSTIHLWDPFEGKTISVMDNSRVAPINVLKPLNPPSCNLIAATTEATLKIIDARLCSYVSEYKVSVLNSVGFTRSICVSPSGNWVAVGQASGLLTVLDVRTGMVLASWKGHEAEVLQLAAIDDNIILSSSLDQTVSAWNVSDGKFKFHMKGPAEPVHCLTVYNNNELITGTTANRIGVHTSIDSQSSFSSTKLRSDAFKGILTSMTVLPLNRLLLLGADNGNINLLC